MCMGALVTTGTTFELTNVRDLKTCQIVPKELVEKIINSDVEGM